MMTKRGDSYVSTYDMKGQSINESYGQIKQPSRRDSILNTRIHIIKQYKNADFPERSVDDSIFAAFFIGGVDDEPLSVAVGLRIDTLIVYDYKSKTGGDV